MSSSEPPHAARALASRSWGNRLRSELEASERFRALALRLRTQASSPLVADMAEDSACDELRHAQLCRELIAHLGGESACELAASPSRLAPPGIEGREGVLYEVVALSCVTETLSTALLAELVARTRDQVCRGAMHEILRDEVKHSRLGWALLAEEHARGVRDCVGRHLPQMLQDTLGRDFFESQTPLEPCATELAGLGFLERPERQRVVQETLEHVIFPGFERFGVDTALGRRWLAGFDLASRAADPT
ncbi:MAG: ferritin-like domain-containing protein [Polyangiaceae bacterium]